MERKLMKNEQTDKKINVKVTKDQGDNTRKITVERHENTKVLPDRGDSNRKTNQITDKAKLNEKKKIVDQSNSKNVDRWSTDVAVDKDVTLKRSLDKKVTATHQNITSVDLEQWRNVSYKYNLKSKNNLVVPSTLVKKNEKTANRYLKNLSNAETNQRKERFNELSNESDKSNTKSDKKAENESFVQRKPIIKTITSKNDARIYKAVSFVNQNRQLPIPLEINIPSDAQKKHKSKKPEIYSMKPNIQQEDNAVAVKEKPVTIRKKMYKKRREKRKKRETISPDGERAISPATEVAKWAPSCLNHHTKPYYEAWVNTTLAATSKGPKKDKLFLDKQNFIQTFQRALEERPESPDLIYDKIHDERYTGRIIVRQKK